MADRSKLQDGEKQLIFYYLTKGEK
jgi:hypothetical protein